jgi:hypothetical protein
MNKHAVVVGANTMNSLRVQIIAEHDSVQCFPQRCYEKNKHKRYALLSGERTILVDNEQKSQPIAKCAVKRRAKLQGSEIGIFNAQF